MKYDIIKKLMENGVDEDELLSSLFKTIPSLAKKASKLLSGGWNSKEVLDYFSKDRHVQKAVSKGLKPTTPNEIANLRLQNSYQNIPKSYDEENLKNLQEFTKFAAPLAVSTFITPFAQKAVQRALPQVSGVIGNLLGNGKQTQQPQENLPKNPISNTTTSQQPPLNPQTPIPGQSAPTMQAPVQPNIAQPQQPIQSEVKTSQSKELIEKFLPQHLLKGLLSNKKNDATTMAATFKHFHPKEVAKVEKAAGKSIVEVFEEYLGQEATPQQAPIEEPTSMEPQGQELDVSAKAPDEDLKNFVNNRGAFSKETEQPKSIQKKETVATPQGIGEVKEIRNGKALVEIDGKLHKVDEEDLERPPYTDDEIADAYDHIMKIIPEEHRSGFISWAGYDEDRNVLGFIPRGGKYEELTDITPEEAKKVKEGKGVARTTGEVREGLWILGEDTRGGVISQIIHDRKKKHKAAEEKQLKFNLELPKVEKEDKGMKPIFDEMAYARNLSRERERKKKLEEREKKKKEKDEAKKRKKQT